MNAKPTLNKYAGVTLDWYDDELATLRRQFPTAASLPDIIKTADVRPAELLQNEDFALVAVDSGNVMRKYACHDPGTTALSVIYFMEHGDKLPRDAQKTAAVNLCYACRDFGLVPPKALLKCAFIGPLLDVGELGIPSAIGYVIGRSEGRDMARMGEERPRGIRGKDVAGFSLIPGYTGYQLGQRGAYDDAMKAMAKKKAKASAVPEPSEAKVAAATSGLIKELLPEALITGSLVGLGTYAALRGTGRGKRKTAEDIITGGKADDMTNSDFPQSQIEKGKKVEMEHTDNPQLAEEISRDHLEEFDDYYTRLDKMEEEAKAEKKANVVDITGKRPDPKIKTAMPTADNDYAVVMPDGSRHYPIDTWDRVKMAELYFQEEGPRMQRPIRRQFAVKLAAKSDIIGYPLDGKIKEAGATTFASEGHVKMAMDMRKAVFNNKSFSSYLDEALEKVAQFGPEVFSKVLHQVDVNYGLDNLWGRTILDPWESTFGLAKTAKVVWEEGADRVTDSALINLAENFIPQIQVQFSYDFAEEFKKDPMGIFESLPASHKKIMARLANDSAYRGGTEATL